MCGETTEWRGWRRFFERRSQRALPRLDVSKSQAGLPRSLARSIAIFQLGESGGGMIVEQARRSRLAGVGEDYAEAIALIVKEEHRHANLLAMCVRMLGGTLMRRNWTARLFVAVRRLIGLRFKVLVLLAAEVVGICYYHLLATRLPDGQIRTMLLDIVDDERAHLRFHCRFLRDQTRTVWRRFLFVTAWRCLIVTAAVAVTIDHRAALRDLGVSNALAWQRWMTYGRLAERLVVACPATAAEPAPGVLA